MKKGAIHIAIAYFVLGITWIFLSDSLLTGATLSKNEAFFIQLAKGGAYVLVTSLLLYYLVKRHSINLQQREAYLSSILDSQSNFLIRIDLQGNYAFVNKAFCRKYGYREKEIIGQSYEQYIMAEDHEKVEHMLKECIFNPERIVPLKTHRYNREGRRFTTSWEFVAITNARGEVVGVQAVGQDVTREQAIYRQLVETKERLENIVSTMQDVVWSARADDLSILYINTAGQEVTGYTQQEFYQDKQLWMHIIHPEDQQRVKEELTQFLTSH